MKKIIVFLIFSLVLCGCESTSKESEIDKIMKENEYTIVDVRTKSEYDEGHLVGAINIPYDEIDRNTNLDKDNVIFVYCKSGNRSGKAYSTLKSLGYTVYDLGAYSSIDLPKE